MALPSNIDLPCCIIGSAVGAQDITVSFRVVDEPVYKGQTFTSLIARQIVAKEFPDRQPTIGDYFIIRKRGAFFTFGPNYTPLNV